MMLVRPGMSYRESTIRNNTCYTLITPFVTIRSEHTMAALAPHLVACPVMIGHAAQLAALHQGIDRVKGGHRQAVLIAGEAGVGKTRLAAEAKSYAAKRGFVLLEATCFPQDSACPYAPLLDLLHTQFTVGALP